ncbi:MAG: leucyl/phenylalanyl-tRNA--protein transferase [Pseudomonadota bacterium]|nr:leucyl/phenylalanyl-tRNA--protein transferase [Pseudomonadota bacterium]
MPVFRLNELPLFPPPELAEAGGLLAVGGDLRPERLLAAYRSGIFPWYSEGEPIWWHSPDPRFVLEPEKLHLPRSLAKILRRGDYEIRFDTAFIDVMTACARTPRPNQRGTWITRAMVRAYQSLFDLGLAHSAEAWRDGELVGGLYGVSLGDMYFGESMFTDAPDASKCAFAVLVRWMHARGVKLIDSQVHTEHLARFGAEHWPRPRYLARLHELVERDTRQGPWHLEPGDPALSF